MKSITSFTSDSLRYFSEVAKAGSFHKGARTLRLSQPSVSRAVQKLEAELGVKLLTRSRSGVSLTHAGKLLLDLSEKYHLLGQDLQRRLSASENVLSGCLVVGSYESLAQYLWPVFLSEFSRQHPHLQIQIMTNDPEHHREKLLAEHIHLVIEAEPRLDERLYSSALYDDRFGVYVSRSYSGPNSFSDGMAPFIYVSRARDREGYTIAERLAEMNISHRLAFDLEVFPSVITFGKAGLGYMVLPTRLADAEIENGSLEAVRYRGRPFLFGEHRICATQLEATRHDPRISSLIRALKTRFKR